MHGKILIVCVFEQWVAEDRPTAIYCIDLHAIDGVAATFDSLINCVAPINQVIGDFNFLVLCNRMPRSMIVHEQVAIADLKASVLAKDIVHNRDALDIGGIEVQPPCHPIVRLTGFGWPIAVMVKYVVVDFYVAARVVDSPAREIKAAALVVKN